MGTQQHYVFADLQPKLITDVVDVMKNASTPAGTDIITQGEVGDVFYVLIQGNAIVRQPRDKGSPLSCSTQCSPLGAARPWPPRL